MGGGNEGSCMISSGRLESIGVGSVSFFNDIDTNNEPCSWVSV